MATQTMGYSRQLGGRLGALTLLAVVYLTLGATPSPCQVAVRPGPPKVIDAQTQAAIIDSVVAALNDMYVFSDVADKMEKFLRNQYRDKKYDQLTDMMAFTMRLTEDMRSVSGDGHLNLLYIPADAMGGLRQSSEAYAGAQATANYGFERVEHMTGNVGYLKLNEFGEPSLAAPTAVAAMKFLESSDAIIIDLRDNAGGHTGMVQLLCSYFFDHQVRLNDSYWRKGDSTKQFWTCEYVPGKRLPEVPLYVLTSAATFSAGEEFAYDLKSMKRATVIGEVTGGAAHFVQSIDFPGLDLVAFVPYGRAVNPITDTNWEGVGVKPDIEVPRDQALIVAHLAALKGLRDKTEAAEKKASLDWEIDGLEAKANPVTPDPATMTSCVGFYGTREITLSDGALFYQRQGRQKFRLIPMAVDRFGLDGLDNFRIQFVRDSNGVATELVGMYNNGQKDRTPRNQ